MAKPGRVTQAKRNRERAKQERQQEKQEQRAIRKEQKKDRAELLASGVDPDLDGIFPGPQPLPEDSED